MKIAIATDDGAFISEHFGRTPYFAIYEIKNGTPERIELRHNTFTPHMQHGMQHEEHKHRPGQSGHGHETIANALSDCKAVISHGMGRRAWEDLRAAGIEMIVTNERLVEEAVKQYIAGDLRDHTEKLH